MKPGNLRTGRAEVLKHGSRLAVFCSGPVCYSVLEAVADLDGVAVVDLVFAKPLDTQTVRDVVKACRGRFIVVEDGCIHGGVGSAVVETLHDLDCPLKFRLLGVPDAFIEHGSLSELRKTLGLDAAGIRRAVSELL
jgi:1-deoxy-D-xylulose-5-phosphate synthase